MKTAQERRDSALERAGDHLVEWSAQQSRRALVRALAACRSRRQVETRPASLAVLVIPVLCGKEVLCFFDSAIKPHPVVPLAQLPW
jgi:hypothetical protein